MKPLSLFINSLIPLFLIMFFTPVLHGEVTNTIDQKFLKVIQQNRVVLTCYDTNDNIWGGQGTITQVDQTGVWITTAAHVAHDSSRCDAEFRDGSVHTAYLSTEFRRSDVAVIFAPKVSWTTHAAMKSLKMGEHLYVFGEDVIKYVRDSFGFLIGLMFDFNDKVYDGTALSRMPGQLIRYPVHKGNLVLTNLYAHPGSSGGGVYDDDGNLVAVVSGGSEIDEYVTYVVDVNKSFDEELAAHTLEARNVR